MILIGSASAVAWLWLWSRSRCCLWREGPQAIRSARTEVHSRAWSLVGENAPDADGQVVVDLDGVLVIAYSDEEDAAATRKKTYGHHPLTVFLDPHRAEPVSPLPPAEALPAGPADPHPAPPLSAARWLSYSVGMVITEAIHEHVLRVHASA